MFGSGDFTRHTRCAKIAALRREYQEKTKNQAFCLVESESEPKSSPLPPTVLRAGKDQSARIRLPARRLRSNEANCLAQSRLPKGCGVAPQLYREPSSAGCLASITRAIGPPSATMPTIQGRLHGSTANPFTGALKKEPRASSGEENIARGSIVRRSGEFQTVSSSPEDASIVHSAPRKATGVSRESGEQLVSGDYRFGLVTESHIARPCDLRHSLPSSAAK